MGANIGQVSRPATDWRKPDPRRPAADRSASIVRPATHGSFPQRGRLISSHLLDDGQDGDPCSPLSLRPRHRNSCLHFSVLGDRNGLWRFRYRRQYQIQHEDNTFDETEWGLQLRGTRGEPNPPRPGPSFRLLLRRSALPLIFSAIMAFKASWRRHFALALGCYVVLPLVLILLSTLLVQRTLKKRRPFQRPPLSFLFGFPVAVTLLVVDLDLTSAWARGSRIGPGDCLVEPRGHPGLCRLDRIFCSEGQAARAANRLLIAAKSTVLAANST